MPPAKDSNQLYSVNKTHMWFAVSSIVLTVGLFLMLFQDYDREWKRWQRKFIELDQEKSETQLEFVKKAVDQKKLEELNLKLKTAQEEFAKNKQNYETLLKEKQELSTALVKVKTKFQDLKQYVDSYKFYLEEVREHGHKKETEEYQKKLTETLAKFEVAKLEHEKIEKRLETIDLAIQKFEAGGKDAEKEIAHLLRDQKILEKKIEKLEPTWWKSLLNAPMLDFIAPTLQVQQIVLEDLYDDFYFAKSQKVDRCTTCHLAIDRKGFEDAPQPFKTHPNLDLYLGSASPHQIEKVGCTVCHGGSGQSLSFTHAAHTPQNEEQAKEWKKKYHWHELEKWEAKMLPLQHTQASCTKCHQGVVNVPEAPKLNEGRQLAMKYGCFGCHTVKGFENQWKAGPDLANVQSKLEKEWIVKWLQSPKGFRASTQMPSIFHLENTISPDSKAKSNIAIHGITSYLMKHSGEVSLEKPRTKGDPEVGKQLVKDLGCLGCHNADTAKVNDHGPELIHMGSKVTPEWLYTWLKDPKHYSKETRMPNLRLSDEEASHVVAYLLGSKNEAFDKMEVPQLDQKRLDHFVMDYLSRKMRKVEAESEMAKMDQEAKLDFVGREIILQQGCYGCHNIPGFESMKPIGTELTREGQKEVSKLYFGFVDIEKTRQSWFFQKLKHPRSFDKGKEVAYHEKLRMPEFGFTDAQANALVTFLLSLREEQIPMQMKRNLNLREKQIEEGRHLVAKYNCQGCHSMDGIDGRIRSLYEDAGNAPPILSSQGSKVNERWFYNFLQDPSNKIRPWLKVRMPTFGFDEAHTNTVIKYFSNLDKTETSFGPSQSVGKPSEATLAAGKELFMKFKCIQCHQSAAPGLTASFLAPDLILSKERLKPHWVVEWLKDPQALMPGTMMPGFFPDGQSPVTDILDGDWIKQIEAIRDYLWHFNQQDADEVKAALAAEKKV